MRRGGNGTIRQLTDADRERLDTPSRLVDYGRYPQPAVVRLMRRVEIEPDGCWVWTGSKVRGGYGMIGIGSAADGTRTNIYVHRLSYELFVGPIPAGLTLDHLCKVTSCINPDHLEPVTKRTNILRSDGPTAQNARKSICGSGHPFDSMNTYVSPNGGRYCRTCRREGYYRRRKGITSAAA